MCGNVPGASRKSANPQNSFLLPCPFCLLPWWCYGVPFSSSGPEQKLLCSCDWLVRHAALTSFDPRRFGIARGNLSCGPKRAICRIIHDSAVSFLCGFVPTLALATEVRFESRDLISGLGQPSETPSLPPRTTFSQTRWPLLRRRAYSLSIHTYIRISHTTRGAWLEIASAQFLQNLLMRGR